MSKATKAAPFMIAIVSLCFIFNSLTVIVKEYIVPLYWDEWEIGKFVASAPSYVDYTSQVFFPQNEHIIAPTKVLFFLDLRFFYFTNLPLVLSFAVLAVVTAFLLAALIFYQQSASWSKFILCLVFTATGVSLVQCENLMWGFQSQFEFVLIGALSSIFMALFVTEIACKRSAIWMALICFSVGFSIFSMGNGVVIPIPILCMMVIRKASREKIAIVVLFSVFYIATFVYLTRHSVPVGDPALKTPLNIVKFFLTMIGSPLTSGLKIATLLGLVFLLIQTTLFIYLIVLPWRRSRPIDGGLLGLFAFTSFLFATAAAAAWGRTSLGVPAAMASRYATPMLLLWMMLFAIPLRAWIVAERPTHHKVNGMHSGALLALLLVVWTGFRPTVMDNLLAFVTPLNQSAYFIASDAGESRLAQLYPVPSLIEGPMAFMRTNHLNMFARHFGLDRPTKEEFDIQMKSSPANECLASSIDRVRQLGNDSWSILGWAIDKTRKTPKWIFAVDAAGKIVGYTPPLIPRADITEVMGAEKGFKGFEAPVHLTDISQAGIALVAYSEGDEGCMIKSVGPLPKGPLPVPDRKLAPISTKVSQDGAVARPGTPAALDLGPPYAGAEVIGTWVTSDADTGVVTLDVADPQCHGFYLPVVRGPLSEGQKLTVQYAGGAAAIAAIDGLQPHKWTLFKVDPDPSCNASSNGVRIILRDEGRSWGEWSAVGTPGLPQ